MQQLQHPETNLFNPVMQAIQQQLKTLFRNEIEYENNTITITNTIIQDMKIYVMMNKPTIVTCWKIGKEFQVAIEEFQLEDPNLLDKIIQWIQS